MLLFLKRSLWLTGKPLKKEDDFGYHHRSRPHHDSSLPYDDELPEDRERDHRPRSPSPSPRRYAPGRPSSTIIVEGLPNDATEDDLLDGFASVSPDAKVFNADNVKVVRLRNNKRGRRIGFVEFFGVNDAAHFLEYHYPGLEFQLAHSCGVDSELVSVGINYSRGRDDEGGRDDRGRDEQDWKCPEASSSPSAGQLCHGSVADHPQVRVYELWNQESMPQMPRCQTRSDLFPKLCVTHFEMQWSLRMTFLCCCFTIAWLVSSHGPVQGTTEP